MDGLLDLLQSPDAQLGLQLLAAGGYSPTPMSAGQRISGALQNYNSSRLPMLSSRWHCRKLRRECS